MKRNINLNEIPSSRSWRGHVLTPVEEVLMFHRGSGPVVDTLHRIERNLNSIGVDYVIIGAIALSAHRYSRATSDVDVCLPADGFQRFRDQLVGREYQVVEGRTRRFFDPQTQTTLDVLVAGDLAGRTSRNKVIRFPDPAEAVEINGLRTVTLARLVELKLVTWRLKDWADVIELIRANQLTEDFSEQLDPLVQMAYLECYDQMKEEEKYDREHEQH
jgi:hypothetical protein